jgi:hypothetical protein
LGNLQIYHGKHVIVEQKTGGIEPWQCQQLFVACKKQVKEPYQKVKELKNISCF